MNVTKSKDRPIGVLTAKPLMADAGAPGTALSPELHKEVSYRHRLHQMLMRQRMRNGLATEAFLRTLLGWDNELPEEERKAIRENAKRIRRVIETYVEAKAKGQDVELGDYFQHYFFVVNTNYKANLPFLDGEEGCKKELAKLGSRLPATDWWCAMRGLSPKQLAEIVGEAGDLSIYPTCRQLWKRLGLAPYEGHAYSNWRSKKELGGLKAEQWVDAGYSGRRRSITYKIGCDILKAKRDDDPNRNPYLDVYEARRAHTAVTHPDWTKGHSHDDGMRIMVKALVKDLHREWCRVVGSKEVLTAMVPAAPDPAPTTKRKGSAKCLSAGTDVAPSAPKRGGKSKPCLTAKKSMAPTSPLKKAA
jgi:hypothetical protein